MPSSLRFVLGMLLLAALCVPVSLVLQREEAQSQAEVLAVQATGGYPAAGKIAFRRLGCGACHRTGMVSGTGGEVGPPLQGLGARAEIAGKLSADPQNLIAWIRHPQTISPGVGMPDIPMSDQDARNVAAYLYTLRGK